jgi:glycosyltransferase involved in cell wall biosynthesis
MGMITGMKNVAFLSTYPPRECGLATFTQDLVKEISKATTVRPYVIAVNAGAEEYADPMVAFKLNQNQQKSYIEAAQWANKYTDLLVIEHEYGIFGGECGEYIIDLVKNLKIPVIITAHTVLETPSLKQQEVLREIGRLSTKLVTMAESSVPILARTYSIPLDKIVVIPHGVPSLLVGARKKLKANHDLKNKHVISTFGLLSPAKGIEYGIKAVAKVVEDFANVVYLILGKTHPGVQQVSGESYRQSLVDLSESLGIRDNIRFVDKYLTKEDLFKYLYLSDIYLTPYLSKEQSVSGTLAYAIGCGRVVVSTPYRYAQEMLSEGRGLLGEFRDADSLAECMGHILHNPLRKKEMELKTLAIGRLMTWDNVARCYTQLFTAITEGMRSNGMSVG